MPRVTVIGNDHIAITFDGKINVSGLFVARDRLRIQIVGHFVRIKYGRIEISFSIGQQLGYKTLYMPETLISRTLPKHPKLEIQLETNNGVHHSQDILLRKVIVRNFGSTRKSGSSLLMTFTSMELQLAVR